MTVWFQRLFWVVLGLHIVGMVMLAGESLPSAAELERTGAAAPRWTFPANCLPW